MTTAQLERAELLFRRQIALEASAPPRKTILGIDAVPMAADRLAGRSDRPACSRRRRPSMPADPLLASSGYFNASRIGPEAATWLFLVGRGPSDVFEKMLLELCNVQSATKNFRPVFVLEIVEHIELVRKYGFSFEYIARFEDWFQTPEEQIDVLKTKWGAQYCLDLSQTEPPSSSCVER